MTITLNDLCLVVPIKNEKTNPSLYLKFLETIYQDYSVIFVFDDHDESALAELKALAPIRFKTVKNQGSGVGDAIVTGLKASSAKYAGIMCCDDIWPLYYLDLVSDAILADEQSIVSLTRYAKGGKRLHGDRLQILFSTSANLILWILTGVSDVTSAARFGSRSKLLSLYEQHETQGWEVNLVFLMRALNAGLPINELPVVSVDRLRHGQSSFNFKRWLVLYLGTLAKSYSVKRNKGHILRPTNS